MLDLSANSLTASRISIGSNHLTEQFNITNARNNIALLNLHVNQTSSYDHDTAAR